MGPLPRSVMCGGTIVRRASSRLPACNCIHRCKLLVVGGGTGGCNVAWRFARKLKNNDIIVLEPSQYHYYQPLFTLVAAGMKRFNQSKRPEGSVLPPNVCWFRDSVDGFDPCNSVVYTRCGDKICYEFMVVALGLVNDYDKILGLKYQLDNPKSCVSTIYSPEYCQKTWDCIKNCCGGHAVFTFPARAGKCSGAAQKIMYLADDYWRQKKVRRLMNITYNTGADALFGVPKYARTLNVVVRDRGIAVNCLAELVEVTPTGALFESVCKDQGGMISLPYNFLHVTPPMRPPDCLAQCSELATPAGYLDVDKHTLQHNKFPNIYGIGDCTSTPNSKTAAAVACQGVVVEHNLLDTMNGKLPTTKYDGYGACPMLTSYKKGILAEFVYDKKPWETTPFDQSKERRLFCYMKKHLFPYLYWNQLIKGKFDGPARIRKFINPFGR